MCACVEGDDVDGVRSTYAGLYSLDATDAGDAAAARALAHPDDYVLKPVHPSLHSMDNI